MYSSKEPVQTFGILADVQYADEDNGSNYDKTRTRYYRGSVDNLTNAIHFWRGVKPNLGFILQLGDHIDGICKRKDSEIALQTALRPFSSCENPTYHVIGNHELYNFSREDLLKSELFSAGRKECQSQEGCFYYSVQPHPCLRVVAIDCYDLSLLGVSEDSDTYQQAYKIIRRKNKNDDLHCLLGLPVEDMRFAMWNGAVSSKQLQWLDTQLKQAEQQCQNVIVFGHLPLLIAASDPRSPCWNAEDVLQTFHKYSCVVSYLCGHHHDGGHAVDNHGLLHVTIPGIIERSPEDNSFSTGVLYPDRLDIVGQGIAGSFSVKLPYPIGS